MTVKEEGIYQGYRSDITHDLVKLMQIGEAFRIEGKPGMGKSKFLRYFCLSQEIQEKHLVPSNIVTYYIDLNKVYKQTSDNLIEVVCNILEADGNDIGCLENKIEELSQQYTKIYLIFDHGELIDELPEQAIRLLRAIRDEYKEILVYALAYNQEKIPDSERIQYLLGIANLKIEIAPLSQKETKTNIKFFADKQSLELNKNEIDKIATACRGIPMNIRQALMQIIAGATVDEAIEIISKENLNYKDDDTVILEKAIMDMTKSEYQVFEVMLRSKGKVITRDELATLLNPESGGDGVSNESIDQLISRIRKSIAKSQIPVSILTKRGVGYYVE